MGGLSHKVTCRPNCHEQRTTGMPWTPLSTSCGWVGPWGGKPSGFGRRYIQSFICPPHVWTQGGQGVVLGPGTRS